MTSGEPDTLEAWLARAGLDRLAPVFRANGIDLDVVARLTEADLRELGLTLGDRKRVLAAVASAQTVPPTSLSRRSDAEHRQLTVLFCDLVGSTALARRLEPEDLNRLLGEFRSACTAAVTRFDGIVAKFLGDGVLVYFGFPIAHEDDPERAVRAALAMVEAIVGLRTADGEPIAARVGVATGLVVVGHVVESGLAREHDASGDTLNLAARLQDIAGPNSVVVAETTRRLLGDLFEDIELGPQHLKGFERPEPAWLIVRSRAPGSRFLRRSGQYPTTFVGRDSEVGLLADRWQQACEGDGQVVLLSGEAGIGKSRLVERLHQEIGSAPHRRVDFQCSPHHTGSALFPVIVRLEQAAGFAPEDSSAQKLDKLGALLAANPEGQTGETAALMAALLSIEAEGRLPPLTMTPERQRQLTLDSLVRQVTGFAHRVPSLLVFEDVHWSDATTLEWLGRVIDLAARARMMVVITCRPEFVPAWPGSGHISGLQLNRLSRRHVAEIVDAQSSGKALPEEVREQILMRADGVPLFVEELTRTVLQSDLLREEAEGYRLVHPLPALAIPATLQDSLTARLDRLGPAKEIAQIGAALGREFTHALIEAVAVEQRAVLDDGLQRLMEAGLLFRTRGAPDTAYMFKHALVRDAAYAGLLKSRRQRIHAEIVGALDTHFPDRAAVAPELLAYHYGEAGLSERAIPYWQQAGQQALRRSANLEAVQHLSKGLESLKMLPDTPARAQHELLLQSTLGPALMATRGYGAPEVEAVYNRALALCRNVGETPQLFGTLMGLWQFYLFRAQHQTARELAERLLGLAESTGEPALLVQAHRALGETFQNLGELIPAQKHLAQGSVLNETLQGASNAILNDPGVFCLSFESWVLWLLGYPERAIERSQAALTLARRLSHPHTLAALRFFAAMLHQFRREFHLCQQQAEAVIELALEQELPVWVPYANIVRGWALAMQGQGEEGIIQIQQGLVAQQDLETAVARPVYLAMLAEAHTAAGQIETGLGILAEALAYVERTEERYYEAELYRLRGELLLRLAVPDAHHAEACFQRALAVAQRQQAASWELRTATSLSRLWRQQGKQAEAHEMLAPIYGRFTEGFETTDFRAAEALLER